jgi:microcystin-dependent protein
MDPSLGESRLFPYTFAPQGWAFCNGQLLAISQNTALVALIGTIYGGDGRTTFALPDLRGSPTGRHTPIRPTARP